MAIGHTGQRPGTLSVVGYSAGQGTQNAKPRVAGSLHRIRPVAGRERPVVSVAGAAVIAVGRAGLCSHLACNERSREHRCRTTRTNTDGGALSFWSLSRTSYYERSTTERRRSVMRTTTSETFDIDRSTKNLLPTCTADGALQVTTDDRNPLGIAHRKPNATV